MRSTEEVNLPGSSGLRVPWPTARAAIQFRIRKRIEEVFLIIYVVLFLSQRTSTNYMKLFRLYTYKLFIHIVAEPTSASTVNFSAQRVLLRTWHPQPTCCRAKRRHFPRTSSCT